MTDPDHHEPIPAGPDTPPPDGSGNPTSDVAADQTPQRSLGLDGVTRVWTPIGEKYLRSQFEQGRRYHGDYDQQAIRTRIGEQIDELRWQPPQGMVPFSSGSLLMAVIPQLKLTVVTAIALNGHLDLPDGPQTATYSLLGVEGTELRVRQRLYLLDVGDGAVLLCADIATPTRALGMPASPGTAAATEANAATDDPQAGEGRG